ncbi:MAG: ATP-binding cassette domain-containing protein [Candidatus Thorarchaeota archaeon]|nr:ATP-binding cassette domain-containing protein [Candidatus Thorarchaeota archaeon]
MTDLEKAIETKNLTKYYGNLLAVDHVTFEVNRGEIFGFLGPNGAGKTTTVRMFTGLTRPSDGTATIFGHDIEDDTIAAKTHVGIVPETSNVYNKLSTWDNMMFTGELYHVSKSERERRAKEILEMFNLYDRRKDKAKSLSKGMKRRLAISMGLINDPKLLFLDEPTSGLDVQSAIVIKDVIKRLNEEGVTIFLTTHDIEEASVICNRVAIIHKGKIAAIDKPEKLKQTIESVQSIEIVFDDMSSISMNELDAIQTVNEVQKVGNRFRLYTHDTSTALWHLWEYLRNRNLRPITINTYGPNLEDVFVRLTETDTKEKKEERN